MKLRMLGSGTSSGVPRVGTGWGACDPANPRNRRRRVSIIVESATTRILVDTGPDLREQLLDADIADVDAVIWTHDHADHCHGIDDLRQLFHARGAPVRGLARAAAGEGLRSKFAYAFEGKGAYPPLATLEPLPDTLVIGDIAVTVADQPHGAISSAGLRFTCSGKSIGYATDFNEMTQAMASLYERLDLWVVDALREAPHPTHPHLSQVLGWIERLRPGHAVLTHMDHTMDYATVAAQLPPQVEPGYDGLEMTL